MSEREERQKTVEHEHNCCKTDPLTWQSRTTFPVNFFDFCGFTNRARSKMVDSSAMTVEKEKIAHKKREKMVSFSMAAADDNRQ